MKYPNGEIVWVSYYNCHHELRFIITSKALRDFYFLYEATKEGFIKLGRAKNPKELESKFDVENKL